MKSKKKKKGRRKKKRKEKKKKKQENSTELQKPNLDWPGEQMKPEIISMSQEQN